MGSHRKRRKLAPRVGTSPGTLVIPHDAVPTSIRLVRFDAGRCDLREDVAIGELPKLIAEFGIAWIDVVGLGSESTLVALREAFQVPYLAMADVVNVPQRPKLESHRESLLAIFQIPRPGEVLDLDQLSIFAKGRVVMTFREHEDGMFDAPRSRVQDPASRLRASGADYLFYRLVDCAVDGYFRHVDRLADRMDAIEHQAVDHPGSASLQELYSIRRDLGVVLRAALPSRDVLASCTRDASGFFGAEISPYMRDVLDHAAQVVELVDHHRQAAIVIQELIVATLDLRMNQVMKVLTAVTVIFIPLSFIAGVYGMNFKHMPELDWRFGYLAVLLVLATIGAWIFWRLKRVGWMRLEEK